MPRSRFPLAVLAAIASIGLLAAPAFASATIVQPNQSFAGKNYAQWSIAWWRWAFSFGATSNPFADASGASCGANQHGAVWFLGGQGPSDQNPTGETSPTCTVPEDKAVLVPVINGECSTVEDNGPDLAGCAKSQMDAVNKSNLSASVDGQPVTVDPAFRVATAPYSVTITSGNPLVGPEVSGTGTSVADGYYLLLRPLTAGRHKIDVHGEITGAFSITTHYSLNVTG